MLPRVDLSVRRGDNVNSFGTDVEIFPRAELPEAVYRRLSFSVNTRAECSATKSA